MRAVDDVDRILRRNLFVIEETIVSVDVVVSSFGKMILRFIRNRIEAQTASTRQECCISRDE
jgi:hypothetical protein